MTLQRHDWLLLIRDTRRFSLFINFAQADLANLNWHFEDTLINALIKGGANQQPLNRAIPRLIPGQFDTVHCRVQGSKWPVILSIRYISTTLRLKLLTAIVLAFGLQTGPAQPKKEKIAFGLKKPYLNDYRKLVTPQKNAANNQ